MSSESIGARCGTGRNSSAGAAPTRWVGESGVISSGNVILERAELADQLVVLGVRHLGVVEDVVAVHVVVDELAELLDPELGLGEVALVLLLVFLGFLHPAISRFPATPIRSPTTNTPPRTPGTLLR